MKKKLIETAGRWFLGGFIREIAEGKRGKALQSAYLALAGKKTYIGLFLAVILGALATYEPALGAKVASYAGPWIALLVGAGLLDKAWRTERPAWASDVLSNLSGLSAGLAIGVSLITHVLGEIPGCEPCLVWHDRVEDLAMGVGAASLWLNRFLAEPPAAEKP